MPDIKLVQELSFNKFLDMFWDDDANEYRPFSYDGLYVIWDNLQEYANSVVVDSDTFTVDYSTVNEMYTEYDSIADYARKYDMSMVVYLGCSGGDSGQLMDDLEQHGKYDLVDGCIYVKHGTVDLRWDFLSAVALEPADAVYVKNLSESEEMFTMDQYKKCSNMLDLCVTSWINDYVSETDAGNVDGSLIPDGDPAALVERVLADRSEIDSLGKAMNEVGCYTLHEFVGTNPSLFMCAVDDSFSKAVDDLCVGDIDGDFQKSYYEWIVKSVNSSGPEVISGGDGSGPFITRE